LAFARIIIVIEVLQEVILAPKKVIFIAFAIEDETQRDFLKGQSVHPRSPFEFVDMSVKEPYDAIGRSASARG
jgi:hypothetical protein